jgi:hypothetical protein
VLVFLVVFWAVILYGPRTLNADGDLGRHITIGQHILRTRQIPTADIFSHTMTGEPLIPHEWLSQTLFGLVARELGLKGVVWLTGLVLASTYALLTHGARQLGTKGPIALMVGIAAAITGSLHWLTRPHIFTLLFFTVFLLALEQYRQKGALRALAPLPLLLIIWVSLHGAFITGIVLVLLYSIGAALDGENQKAAVLMGLTGVLVLAAWVNPVGPRLMMHSFQYLGQRFLVDMTQEYRSPDFHVPSTWGFAAMLLGSLAMGWMARRRMSRTSLWLLGVWSAFGLYSARHIPLYALVAALILGQEAEPWLKAEVPRLTPALGRMHAIDQRAGGWIWAALVVAVAIGMGSAGVPLDLQRAGPRFDPNLFPVAALDTLGSDLPAGEMFNEFAWGGYLLYRLWPERQVFIDGQTDFYGEELSRQYAHIIDAGPQWEARLAEHGVTWVIIPPTRPLAAVLDLAPAWERIYTDATAAVWVRRGD